MEFSGQYLTYSEYLYLGGTLAPTSFNILEFECRRRIDLRTQNRLKNCEEIPQEVKMCEFEMMQSIKKYIDSEKNISTESGNIVSENIDGYSVTYDNLTLDKVQSMIESKKTEIDNILYNGLVGVIYNGQHIAYLGVDKC